MSATQADQSSTRLPDVESAMLTVNYLALIPSGINAVECDRVIALKSTAWTVTLVS